MLSGSGRRTIPIWEFVEQCLNLQTITFDHTITNVMLDKELQSTSERGTKCSRKAAPMVAEAHRWSSNYNFLKYAHYKGYRKN